MGHLRSDCAAAGVLLDATHRMDDRGRAVPLQLTSRRYTEMQQHFDRIGPAGRTMMRLTASTQVCLDWWPGRAGLEQWHLLQLAGPFVAALFARGSGPGSRLATWLEVDPGRTAYDDRLIGGDPVGRYTDFAAGAVAFAMPDDAQGKVRHHLSTLFPPVRPRDGYLEVRFLDALPEDAVPAVATLLATLVFDDDIRREALRLLGGESPHLAARWRLAATAPGELVEQGRTLSRAVPAGHSAGSGRLPPARGRAPSSGAPRGSVPGGCGMNVLLVTDPLEGLDAGIDSNVGLMAAVRAEGAAAWACEPQDLAVVGGRLLARGRRIDLRHQARRGDHRWHVESPWFEALEQRVLDVAEEVDLVLLRLDPPVDARYLRTTYLLDVAVTAGVPVLNRPAGVRELQEKLFILRFPELCPPTVVTADPLRIEEFLRSHGDAVVKPVDGFAGIDVWLLRREDPNMVSLVESATAQGTRHVVVQQFLSTSRDGNKRLFVLDGEIAGAVNRVPSPEDFRIGPPSAPAAPDARDREIVRVLAPELDRLGVVLAGLDVIDGRLIEVNVTCPGGMHKTDALLGTDLSGVIVRRLLRHSTERVLP